MTSVTYTGGAGPDTISAGAAGSFTKGETRVVEDQAVADQLLTKGCFIAGPPTVRVTRGHQHNRKKEA
jgi:hypothetical protein